MAVGVVVAVAVAVAVCGDGRESSEELVAAFVSE